MSSYAVDEEVNPVLELSVRSLGATNVKGGKLVSKSFI
jgi:hypothetical protein